MILPGNGGTLYLVFNDGGSMPSDNNHKINPIELQKSLKGVDYPANKGELQKHAKDHGAKQEVMHFLEQIPEQDYDTPAQVTKQISGDQPSTQKGSKKR